MRRVVVPHELSPALPPAWCRVRRLGGRTMGTSWTVTLAAPAELELAGIERAISEELGRIIAEMSTWDAGSDISRFNRAGAGSEQVLPTGFSSVLTSALTLARDSGGAYDPTVGPLVDLWGFGPAGLPRRLPGGSDLEAARARVGWQKVAFDRATGVLRQIGGVHLDLSSIAKGFAVDRVATRLKREGISDALVEVGGELSGFGMKPDASPWWVALEAPVEAGHAIAPIVVALHGLAAATSGDYRRSFRDGDKLYSHTIDPRNGWPVKDAPASVTVLHRECMMADGLATLLTVMGVEEGLAFAGARGFAARFVIRQGEAWREEVTPAFAAMLQ